MKLTPSQVRVIEQKKRITSRVFSDATFTIYIPKNTNIVRLIAEYKMKNVLGDMIPQSNSWTIGKRGKIS